MTDEEEFKKKILGLAEERFQARLEDIPEDMRDRVKARFDRFVNERGVLQGLSHESGLDVERWLNELIDGSYDLVREGLDKE